MILKNSTFGHQVVNQEVTDPYMEKLGLFEGGKLTKEGKMLLSLFEKAEELGKTD